MRLAVLDMKAERMTLYEHLPSGPLRRLAREEISFPIPPSVEDEFTSVLHTWMRQ